MHPALTAFLLALPVVAAVGWWRLFRSLAESTTRALFAGFFTVVQFSGGLALLGWIGVLHPLAVLAVQALLTIAVWAAPIWLAIPERRSRRLTVQREDLWVLLAVGLIVGLVLLRALIFESLLPLDGSDGSTYHVPALIEALVSGDFSPSDSVVPMAQAGPKVVDMAFLWLMLGWSIDLVLFGQLLFLPVAMAAVAVIARWAGARNHLAWAGGMLVGLIPVVISQLSSAYVDVGGGALLLASVAFTLLYLRGDIHGPIATVAAYGSLGFAAGAKFSLLVPAMILGAVLLLRDLRLSKWNAGHVVGAVVMLLGLGWYLEAWIRFGNPLWPYAVPGLHDVFPYLDTVDALVERELALVPDLAALHPVVRPIAVWFEQGKTAFMYSFDGRLAGLGPLWLLAGLPAYLTWLGIAIRRKEWQRPVALGVLFFGFLSIQTYPWWPRFSWWLVGLGIVAIVLLWQGIRWPARVVLGGLVMGSAFFVFALTSVQGAWLADNFVEILEGADPVEVEAGPVVADAFAESGERIAVPGLAWGSWNTYLRGRGFENEVVVVPAANTADLESALRDRDITMVFVPGSGTAWPAGVIEGLEGCLEEVSNDVDREQILFRFACA